MYQQPFRSNLRRRISEVKNFSPPIDGWVDLNDIGAQSPRAALILRNMIPTRNSVYVRPGSKTINNVGASCRTLVSYRSGNHADLIAGAGGKLFEVPIDFDTMTPEPPIELGTGFSNDMWQTVSMANAADEVALILVNGADGLKRYNHIDGLTTVTTTPNILTLVNVTSHKGRLWFLDLNTSVAYYGEPLSNEPATLTAFPVGPFLKQGGYLVCMESWPRDGGSGPDDYLVFISNLGEIVVFQGLDPAEDFSLVGTFKGPRPLGPRTLTKMATELVLYSGFGPMILSDIFLKEGNVEPSLSPIRNHFIDWATINSLAFGWQAFQCSTRSWMIFNVPIVPPSVFNQFVMNIDTRSWFEITDWNGQVFCTHLGYKFFGDNVGKIKVCDFGESGDDGNAILADFMSTWNEFDSSFIKKFNMAQVTIKSNVVPEIAVDMMLNYSEAIPVNEPGFSGKVKSSPWNISPWNVSPWSGTPSWYTQWFGLAGQGSVGAFRYRTKILDSYHELFSYRIAYEQGEIL